MHRIISIGFFFLCFALLFSGCETPLDITDLDPSFQSEKGIMTVSSTFSPNDIYRQNGNSFEVFVSESQALTSNGSFEPILDAEVALYTNDDWVENLVYDAQSQLYRTFDHVPMIGSKYQLKVSHPDYETVEAYSKVPVPIKLKSTTIVEKQSQVSEIYEDFYELNLKIEVEVEDPTDVENYYHFVFRNRVEQYQYNNNGTVDTSLVKPSKFEPLYSFNTERENEKSAIFINDNSRYAGAYLTDKTFDGQNKIFTFSLVILTNPELPLADQMRVELHSVTKEYYDFHLSAHEAINTGNNPFASEIPAVLGNIKNGEGLFSGFNSSYKIVRLQ